MTCLSCKCECRCHINHTPKPQVKKHIPFSGSSTARSDYPQHDVCPAKLFKPPSNNLSPGNDRFLSTESREKYPAHPISPDLLQTKSPVGLTRSKPRIPFVGSSCSRSDYPAFDKSAYVPSSTRTLDAHSSNIKSPSNDRFFETETAPPSQRKKIPFTSTTENQSQFKPYKVDPCADTGLTRNAHKSSLALTDSNTPKPTTTSRSTYSAYDPDIYKLSLTPPSPSHSQRKPLKFNASSSYRDQYSPKQVSPTKHSPKVNMRSSSIRFTDKTPLETELRSSFKSPSRDDYLQAMSPSKVTPTKPRRKIVFEGQSEARRQYTPKKCSVTPNVEGNAHKSSIDLKEVSKPDFGTESRCFKPPTDYDKDIYRSIFEEFVKPSISSPKKKIPFQGSPTSRDFQPPSPEHLRSTQDAREAAEKCKGVARGCMDLHLDDHRDFSQTSGDYKDFTLGRCCGCVITCDEGSK
ncbi:hypothetical protein GEMRC1_012735 [Eukaryota sp. GEM-RC1]